ncbi:MAG: tetratricopeptide repeat protein [Planctomycetes bacterium]|nr:tetratricopeptide repeat protein [Planctomycetota bacterium]
MTPETAQPENSVATSPERAPETPAFDLEKEALSFAALEAGRVLVYESLDAKQRFKNKVEAMPTTGEPGRRRGLGLWVLAEYERSARELAAHETDDTAAYTRARCLFALRRFDEAAAIFQRLADKHQQEPRPRSGLLEAKLESALLKKPEESTKLGEDLARSVAAAPGGFAASVEGLYLHGRAAELQRDLDGALEAYERARTIDPEHMNLLTRFAHLAERSGLDELALELYEELVLLRGIDTRALLNLGVLYEDNGRDADAASCYDTVLRNDATNERARMYLADARAAMNMYYDEDLEKKEDRLNQILRIPITDFELSVRARNCLNKMQITTLGDLVQKTEQELLSYKNFGETSLTEIKEILHSKGLRLGMPRDEAVASIEAHARRLQTGDRSDVMNKPILELSLSIRARRTVETLGCLTVGDVTKHSAEELLGMPNFGQTSLQELRTKLTELNLKLKGE